MGIWFEVGVLVLLAVLVLRQPTGFPILGEIYRQLGELIEIQEKSLTLAEKSRYELAEVTRKLDRRWPEHTE